MRKKSVILLSGGLDSSANLALCVSLDTPVLAITVQYGQRSAAREREAARGISDYYGVRHEVLDLPWLGRLGGSSLTDPDKALPHLETHQLDEISVTRASAQAVWVPNRNAIFIAAAAAFAESLVADQVVVGFNREEAATFPDNSSEFLRRSTEAMILSTRLGVRAYSYTDRMDKREIVAALKEQEKQFPFELVWSCYEGGPKPCGKCESCRRFRRAMGGEAE